MKCDQPEVYRGTDGKDRTGRHVPLTRLVAYDCLALGAHCPVYFLSILDCFPLPLSRGVHLIPKEICNGQYPFLLIEGTHQSTRPLISAIFGTVTELQER